MPNTLSSRAAARGASGRMGDIWGALAATLVALPSAIAFGVAIYAPLGASHAAAGALAGIVGAITLAMVASLIGGARHLITAPCAPAAAVVGALAAELARGSGSHPPIDPAQALLLMTLVALASGLLQMAYGAIGGGALIKYIPYPVVSGYLSGVGLLIFLDQLPKLLGYHPTGGLWAGLCTPSAWAWPGVVVGIVTMAAMVVAPRLIPTVPATILGLAAGLLAYFALGFVVPELWVLAGNRLVIGPLAGAGSSPLAAVLARWSALGQIQLPALERLFVPALTLSVLLSIDTLKTCVVVDTLTRSRHRSNRTLIGQGVANVATAIAGGVPGAGTMGATLVNVTSGGRTRRAGALEGVFVLVAFLVLGRFVAWIPIAALAGILIMVAYRMVDWRSFHLLRYRSTVLDFLVVATVVAVAAEVDLIAASGTGLALAIALFIREQVRSSVLHRKSYGNQVFSQQRRLPAEQALLQEHGSRIVVCELQGNLFFGTTDQLFTRLEPDLATCHFLILDMRRVQSLDFTAAHMLEQIAGQLAERDGKLILSHMPRTLATGQSLERYLTQVGLIGEGGSARVFATLGEAREWTEDRLLEALPGPEVPPPEQLLDLDEMEFLKGRREDTIEALRQCVFERHLEAGERVFCRGDQGDEFYLIRRGAVRIVLPLAGGGGHHLATFTRGDFFGDMAFLDGTPRSADAVAERPTDLFVLSRRRFDAVAEAHPRLGHQLFASLAQSLARRLRRADAEIQVLHEL